MADVVGWRARPHGDIHAQKTFEGLLRLTT
jgi:hypothetical protein